MKVIPFLQKKRLQGDPGRKEWTRQHGATKPTITKNQRTARDTILITPHDNQVQKHPHEGSRSLTNADCRAKTAIPHFTILPKSPDFGT